MEAADDAAMFSAAMAAPAPTGAATAAPQRWRSDVRAGADRIRDGRAGVATPGAATSGASGAVTAVPALTFAAMAATAPTGAATAVPLQSGAATAASAPTSWAQVP